MKDPLCIITPVYNDWRSLNVLLREIDSKLSDYTITVIIVDDCTPGGGNVDADSFQNIKEIRIIRLIQNVGHQYAIATGLSYAENNIKARWYVVTDSDGEDNPQDIVKLLNLSRDTPDTIIFASRGKRSESKLFRLFYSLYLFLFYLFTSKIVSIGNFSCIPSSLLKQVISNRKVFTHYSGSISNSKLPQRRVKCDRGVRYFGTSKMHFSSLCLHGLAALSVYSDIILVRLMLFLVFLLVILTCVMLAAIYVKFFTTLAIPGWATSVILGLFSIMIQVLFVNFLFIFMYISLNQLDKLNQAFDISKSIDHVEVSTYGS